MESSLLLLLQRTCIVLLVLFVKRSPARSSPSFKRYLHCMDGTFNLRSLSTLNLILLSFPVCLLLVVSLIISENNFLFILQLDKTLNSSRLICVGSIQQLKVKDKMDTRSYYEFFAVHSKVDNRRIVED